MKTILDISDDLYTLNKERDYNGKININKNTQDKVIGLYEEIKELVPLAKKYPSDNSERFHFWIKAEEISFDDFVKTLTEEEAENMQEEIEYYYKENYGENAVWIEVSYILEPGNGKRNDYYAVIINNGCISVEDKPHSEGGDAESNHYMEYNEDFSNILEWLRDSVVLMKEKIRSGEYNQWIKDNIPKSKCFGKIKRNTLYEKLPEVREWYLDGLSRKDIEDFISYEKDLKREELTEDEMHEHITAREFYEACGIAYKAMGKEEKVGYAFKDTDEEKIRYKDWYTDCTPKNMYYAYADGRDNGMKDVPLDNADAFEEWLDKKGPYYEFNGSHPWEIIRSGSLDYSIHLYITTHRRQDSVEAVKNGEAIPKSDSYGYCLSGIKDLHFADTVKAYTALKKAGYPVVLSDGVKALKKVLGQDYVGILPYDSYKPYQRHFDDVLDYLYLYEIEEIDGLEKVIDDIEWEYPNDVKLKNA